jgi:sugar phosphate isomerase/epimerase
MRLLRSAVLTGFFPDLTTHAEVATRGIELAAELGYDVIELYYDGPDAERVQQAARSSGLQVVFLAAYFMKPLKLDLGVGDPAERQSAVDRLRGLVDRAALFGADTLMVISGPEKDDPGERSASMARLGESLGEICLHAGQAGMGITLEYFNNSGEPYLLVGPTEVAARLAREVRKSAENFVLTYDLSHALQLGEDPVASLAGIADVCNHVHLANCVIRDPENPLYGDKHPPFGHPDGEVDVDFVCRFVRQVGEAGYMRRCADPLRLAVEVISRPGDEPEEVMTAATAVLDKAIEVINQEVRE